MEPGHIVILLLVVIAFGAAIVREVHAGGLTESSHLTQEEWKYICGLKIQERRNERTRRGGS